jgi:O-acetyl-ADP-ribose deacetylase (regulator of RNase III)
LKEGGIIDFIETPGSKAMIDLMQGDILQADAEAIVNTVNCVGVMGRGIALQFRKAYPENFQAYKAVCDRKELKPGMMFVFDRNGLFKPRYVINFPTKRHWKGKSRMEDIEAGLEALVAQVCKLGIRSIAIPPLGCGLGGLEWKDVRARIEKAFGDMTDVRVLLYEPKGAPPVKKMTKDKKMPHMTVGRAALLGLIRRYLAAAMDPFVTLLEVHKLMYFMQEAGEPLKLRYRKALYGPYAENLRHVLSQLEGHLISGYGDGEDRPDKHIELQAGAVEQAERFIHDYPETLARFERVVDLIEGFELATVHWLARYEGVDTVDDAVSKTYAWNSRKRMFQEKHIHIVWKILERKGWLNKS